MRGVRGLIDLVGDTLHAVFEAAEPFTQPLAELGQLLAAEEHDDDDREDDQMPRLKEIAHMYSPVAEMLRLRLPPLIVAQPAAGIDTCCGTRQMWAERYILVSEAKAQSKMLKAGRSRMLDVLDAGRFKKRGDGCCD